MKILLDPASADSGRATIGGTRSVIILALFVIPLLAVQLTADTSSWIPPTLSAVTSGVSTEVSLWAAVLGIAVWALVPAVTGLLAVQRRDVV